MSTLQERLRSSASEVQGFPHPSHCEHLHRADEVMHEAADRLDELEREVEALRADAERWRHLRVQHEFDDDAASDNNYGRTYPARTLCVFRDDGEDGLEPIECDPGALDAAIDAARSKT